MAGRPRWIVRCMYYDIHYKYTHDTLKGAVAILYVVQMYVGIGFDRVYGLTLGPSNTTRPTYWMYARQRVAVVADGFSPVLLGPQYVERLYVRSCVNTCVNRLTLCVCVRARIVTAGLPSYM